MNNLGNYMFQNQVTSANISNAYWKNDAQSIGLQITGTATSITIQFEGSVDGINFSPVECLRRSDYAISTQTTTCTNEIWDVDMFDIVFFRTNIISISGGNVTIQGVAKG